MSIDLHDVVQGPAQEAVDLPPAHGGTIDSAAAGRLVGVEQGLPRAEAAGRFVDIAKAPGTGTKPAELFLGRADVGTFPIEQRAQAELRIDHHVARTKIAVQEHPRRRGGATLLQPAEGIFQSRVGFPIGCVVFALRHQRVDAVAHLVEHAHFADVDGMQARQQCGGLRHEHRPGRRKGRLRQQALGQGLTCDKAHHIAAPQFILRLQLEDRFGHRQAMGEGHLQ